MSKVETFRWHYNNAINRSNIRDTIYNVRGGALYNDKVNISNTFMDCIYFNDDTILKIFASFVYSDIPNNIDMIKENIKKYFIIYGYCVSNKREDLLEEIKYYYSYELVIGKYPMIRESEVLDLLCDILKAMASFTADEVISSTSSVLSIDYALEGEVIYEEDIREDFINVVKNLYKASAKELSYYKKFINTDSKANVFFRFLDDYSFAITTALSDTIFFHDNNVANSEYHYKEKDFSYADIMSSIIRSSGYDYTNNSDIPEMENLIKLEMENNKGE